MALQTDRLLMVGLGIENDNPQPPSFQPKLADRIHLRWQSKSELGFPWYGYYLLRRPTRGTDPACVSKVVPPPQAPSPPAGKKWDTPVGSFSSDAELAFTEDFAPAANREIDLRNRKALRFDLPPQQMARKITMRVGLRSPVG